MAYCLRSFVETLDQVLNPHQHYKKWVLDHDHIPQIQSLLENATFLQDFLDQSSPLIQETISSLEDLIMDAAQKAADTLETYITDQIRLNPEDHSFTIFPPDLGEVIRVFEEAKQEVSMIKDASQPSNNNASPPRYPDSKKMVVVGVDEDLNQLRSRLTSPRKTELDVIPIVGMGGMGKTTLARILYDEYSSSSKPHFDRCAWVTVSQTYDPQQILKTILACVTGKPLEDIPHQPTNELIVTVYQTLVGRRYLIVLDDIWSYKAWDDVQRAFARENKGSRVIFTSRDNSLADYVKSNGHEMHLINEDQSWELLRRKVFGDESCPRGLEEVGKSIAIRCGGLPLALQVIGGLLANSEKSKYFWEYVAHNISSLIEITEDQFAGIFSWSFSHLPHYLKPCFLYMGAFPEDYEIPSSRIIRLWVAEGFLRPVTNKSLEEAAETHLSALVNRNLIFVRSRKSNGKPKSYGIHDLLRDLCMRKAQEKKFLYVEDLKTDILREDILCIPRVSVHSRYEDGTVYDYGSFKLTPFSRSFLLTGSGKSKEFVSRVCSKSSLLRVLDVYQSPRYDSQEVFLHLINLRYLASYTLSTTGSISVLKNLQTLIVTSLESLSVLEHLLHLRHLQFRILKHDTYSLDVYPHENLQHLSHVPLDNLTHILDKIPNLRKLVIEGKNSLYNNVVDLSCFQKLLTLEFNRIHSSFSSDIIFPESLKALKLCGCTMTSFLNAIGILPGLEVLQLVLCEFENNTWEPSEDEFCQLQYLKISYSGLENWLVTEIHFPVLRHLVVLCCEDLNEIPNDIGGIDTLEIIEVEECSRSVHDSARIILEKQRDFGNTTFQLLSHHDSEEEEEEETDIPEQGFGRMKTLVKASEILTVPKLGGSEELEENVDDDEMKWALPGSKGFETQVSSFCPPHDFFLTSESLGLDTRRSYSLDNSQGSFANGTSAGGQRRGNGSESAGTMASRQQRRKQRKATFMKPLKNTCLQSHREEEEEEQEEDKLMEADITEPGSGRMKTLEKAFDKLTVPNLGDSEKLEENVDDDDEVKRALLGSKGFATQVLSFCPSHDFSLTSESLGLDTKQSYSLDNSQGSFANRTSAGGQRRQNSNESVGTTASRRQQRRKQRKATSLKPLKNIHLQFTLGDALVKKEEE